MKVVRQYGGFLILTLLAFIPAYFSFRVGATANEVGMFYVGALIWSLVAWSAYVCSQSERPVRALLLLLVALLGPSGFAFYYQAPAADLGVYGAFTLLWLAAGWLALRLIESTEEAAV